MKVLVTALDSRSCTSISSKRLLQEILKTVKLVSSDAPQVTAISSKEARKRLRMLGFRFIGKCFTCNEENDGTLQRARLTIALSAAFLSLSRSVTQLITVVQNSKN